jgi:hypothetical protein
MCDGFLTPIQIDPGRQEAIHKIVSLCDSVKHVRNLLFLRTGAVV